MGDGLLAGGPPRVDQFSGIQHLVSVCPGIMEKEDKLGPGNHVDEDLRSGDIPRVDLLEI